MRYNRMPHPLPLVLIGVGLMALIGVGLYFSGAVTYLTTPPTPVALPTLLRPVSPTASATPTPTLTATATRLPPTATPASNLPSGGIVYALSPDINSVGWLRAGETGNHFGESFLYAGVREDGLTYGAMQFDLSFIPSGSTIFQAELELTGLADQGLTADSAFALNILQPEIDADWSRRDAGTIGPAPVDEQLNPTLGVTDLAAGRLNKFIFNAAQRSIIEARLADTKRISFRIDSLSPEGWFAWDSGYGEDSTGQGPVLRLGVLPPVATDVAEATPGTPTPTPTFVIITSTPTPADLARLVAIAVTATYEATTIGTATPIPENWVTPWVVTATPTPENTATAMYQWAQATADVIVYGTSTPTPQNIVTATPTPTDTPTPIFILLEGELPPMTPSPTPSVTLEPTPPLPAQLIGKIAFKSDRTGQEQIYVINPDGSGLALLTNRWPYNMAELADVFSADGRFRVFTKDAIRYRNIKVGTDLTETVRNDAPALYWYDSLYQIEEQVTHFGNGIAYGGVWSPTQERVAFVSNDSGDDEIWVVNRDGSDLRQLTDSNEARNAQEIGKDTFFAEVNKHPSWSPDGSQLVFWSNRLSGRAQIWVMNVDGANLYSLSRTGFNDWDPVWIKYPGIPNNAHLTHLPYQGPYDPAGATRACQDFPDPAQAQAFYLLAGGPYRDPHNLDPDQDGLACNRN